ncbi:ABC transporter permease [Chitinophaga horti]|uniref:ABC transporter permease n=1 Tax=Chitinophaga horti TaxID=2920382 RepID=A0ABY6JAV3_9BACT|nr:ABC transporter permease [Chitinophaga horti]UYQ95444.1 ABC transporter permease [Chitinophaga horti]
MLYNYLKIAWRSLLKDRQFSLLNLVGLSTGLATTLLIWLWVSDERQVDRFHQHSDRLYQVMQHTKEEAGISTTPNTPGLLADALARELPEVERAVTVVTPSWFSADAVIALGDTRMKAAAQFAGGDYLSMFTYKVLQGDTARLRNDRRTIAISDQLAAKLYPGAQALGRTAKFLFNEFSGDYVIAAVFEKPRHTSSDPFDVLFSYDLFLEKRTYLREWGNSDPATYVLLREEADAGVFKRKLAGFYADRKLNPGSSLSSRLYADKYLYDQYTNGVVSGGRITYVKLFTLIAAFILFIACINFTNLSTARAARRMKETGIRKVAGATRGHLVLQHLGESMLISICALCLAVGLLFLLLPAFNQLTGKNLLLRPDFRLLAALAGFTLITGVLAGSYPALYISGFKPALALKGIFKSGPGEAWVRKGLVVFQFTVSVMAICAVTVIYRQIHFIQSKNLGYNREQIIHFEIPLEMDSAKLAAAESFVAAVRQLPGVVAASSYGHDLLGQHGAVGDLQWPGKPADKNVNLANLEVGFRFLQTTGIQLKEGRYFSENANASRELILNESAIKAMGLTDAIGKTVKLWGNDREIVGIAKDFHFQSLYHPVTPCFFQAYPVMPNVIVKIRPDQQQAAIAAVKAEYGDFFQSLPFDYRFMDDEYQAMYASEQRVAVLSKYFSALAVLISCLGLFGLAAFTAQKRRKEIGIRKVLGATVSSVVLLLSKDFLRLLLISVLIAFPLIGYIMHEWLNHFAYSVGLGPEIFLLAAAAMALVTLATISFQSLKAALVNPVKSLQST